MKVLRLGWHFAITICGVGAIAAKAAAQDTTLESVDSSGGHGNGSSGGSSISSNGLILAFDGSASNLVSGDTNGVFDIFVHDRTTGLTERVSVRSNGVEGNQASQGPSISGDGQIVAFSSDASRLVTNDRNHTRDIFVHDRSTAKTERVSVDSSGIEGNGFCDEAAISSDGNIVAFWGRASNLVVGDANGRVDVFVHDRTTGITERVSVDSSGVEGNGDSYCQDESLSSDGGFVAFSSSSSNLVPGDTNGVDDMFVRDRATGITERVSVSSTGAEANGGCYTPSISADGQIVAFVSSASNLVAGDGNGTSDVFVHDRSTGITERISIDSSGVEGNNFSTDTSISSDGRSVAFSTHADNLVAGDANGVEDVFVRDRTAGTTRRVSVDSSGVEGNKESNNQAISSDGQIICFSSMATNFVSGDVNNAYDVYLHELCSTAATWSNYGTGWPGTLGVPTMVSSAYPVLGSNITITISNSLGIDTPSVLILGLAEANVPTSKDGTLLVVPLLYVPLLVPIAGFALNGTVPSGPGLCGLEVDLQTLEVDAGASKGLAFTDGLKLLLGH